MENIEENDDINLSKLFFVIKKRIKLILVIFIVATLSTGVASYLIKPVYRSTFIIRVPPLNSSLTEKILPVEVAEKLINELQLIRKEKIFEVLSKKLNISENKVNSLVSLSAKTLPNEKNILSIVVEVHDPSLINDFKNAILKYINQNDYVNDRISLQRDNLVHLAGDIETRIKDLESVKNYIFSQIKQGGVKTLGFNPIGMDTDIINLKQRLRETTNELKLLRGFEVGVEPEIPSTPIMPKKALNITIAGIASLILGIFVVLFIEWMKINKRDS